MRQSALSALRLIPGIVALTCVIATAQAQPRANYADLLPAIDRLMEGRATGADRALLFANNDSINAGALNAWISDERYQAIQTDYVALNDDLAARAARAAGAEFGKQDRTNSRYSPMTDSDYIMTVQNEAQVDIMQASYNEFVNEYMAENGYAAEQRTDWHRKLDTDFMADPKVIRDPAEFARIADRNNVAYRDRLAAILEANVRTNRQIAEAVRAGKDTPEMIPHRITQAEFTGYAREMNRLQLEKNEIVARMRDDPRVMNDPEFRARYQAAMALEQKYISRIEMVTDILRAQEGLDPLPGDGKTVAAEASGRFRDNFENTWLAGLMSEGLTADALQDLARSMAEAAEKNPAQFVPEDVARDIALLTEQLTIDERFSLYEEIFDRNSELGEEVAKAMEKQPGGAAVFAPEVAAANPTVEPERLLDAENPRGDLDDPTQRPPNRDVEPDDVIGEPPREPDDVIGEPPRDLDPETDPGDRPEEPGELADGDGPGTTPFIDNSLEGMGDARRRFNQRAGQALDVLGKIGTAAEYYTVGQHVISYFENSQLAIDESLSEAQRERHLLAAHQAKLRIGEAFKDKALEAAFEAAMPTVAAAYGAFTIGYEAGTLVLKNTETGQALNQWTGPYMDALLEDLQSYSDFFTGGDLDRARAESDQAYAIRNAYLRSVEKGTLRWKEGLNLSGFELDERLLEWIRNGWFDRIHAELLVRPEVIYFVVRLEGRGYKLSGGAGPWIGEGWIDAIVELPGGETFDGSYDAIVAEFSTPDCSEEAVVRYTGNPSGWPSIWDEFKMRAISDPYFKPDPSREQSLLEDFTYRRGEFHEEEQIVEHFCSDNSTVSDG